MLHTLTKADDSAPKKRLSRIKDIDAILEDRALKTGLVSVYTAGPSPLNPKVAAKMRVESQAIKTRQALKARERSKRRRVRRARRVMKRLTRPHAT